MDFACRVKELALRAHIDIAILVEREVLPAQRAVLSLGLVDDGNVRSDLLVVDDPVERRGRPIGRVRRKSLRFQTEALFGALDHRLRCADLRLTNGARGLDIDDDSELHIDQVVVGVGKKRWSSHRAGPLGRRIGRRHKLRRDLARRTEDCMIEGCYILFHGPARGRGAAWLLPFAARDSAPIFGISNSPAPTNRKSFATDWPGRNTGLNNTLKHAAEDGAVAETLIAGAREY